MTFPSFFPHNIREQAVGNLKKISVFIHNTLIATAEAESKKQAKKLACKEALEKATLNKLCVCQKQQQ
jgi:hypothetical protein